jgi:hypothetical protein
MAGTRKRYSAAFKARVAPRRLPEHEPDTPVTIWVDAPSLARERREDVPNFSGKDRDIGRLTPLPCTECFTTGSNTTQS